MGFKGEKAVFVLLEGEVSEFQGREGCLAQRPLCVVGRGGKWVSRERRLPCPKTLSCWKGKYMCFKGEKAVLPKDPLVLLEWEVSVFHCFKGEKAVLPQDHLFFMSVLLSILQAMMGWEVSLHQGRESYIARRNP